MKVEKVIGMTILIVIAPAFRFKGVTVHTPAKDSQQTFFIEGDTAPWSGGLSSALVLGRSTV